MPTVVQGDQPFVRFASLARITGHLLRPHLKEIVARTRAASEFLRLFGWLRQQPLAGVSVADAARLYYLGDSAFSKRFRRKMGVSFKAYLNAMLVRQAQHQLHYTDRTVGEIAEDLGLVYPQYFHRFFRTHCHCTHTEFRELKGGH